MKRSALLLLLCLGASALRADEAPAPAPAAAAAPLSPAAQASPWKGELISSAGANQATFDNWSAGGQDSVAWNVALNGALKRETGASSWENKLRLEYGQLRLGEAEPRKSADTIHAESVGTRKFNQWVNPFVSAAWDTQFVNGYKYYDNTTFTPTVVSKFMDPGYLTESLGLGWSWREALKLKLGAAAKQTFTDAYPAYADDPDTAGVESFRNEVGAGGQLLIKAPLGKDAVFSSQLDVFSNLRAADQMDVKWAGLLSARINGWLSANLNVDLLYDHKVSSRRQLKQTLSLSASYNLL